jgi:hypothetical protein
MLMIYGRGKGGAWGKAVDHGGFYTVVALEICISPGVHEEDNQRDGTIETHKFFLW